MYAVTNRDGSTVEYLSAAETARLVRAALKRTFPGTTFYVRSRTFSMGAAVDVYFDGTAQGAPDRKAVTELVDSFSGRNFDGMIDLEYGNDVYLDADGMPVGGRSLGSTGSMGVHPAYDQGADKAVRRVHTGVWTHANDFLPYDVRSR